MLPLEPSSVLIFFWNIKWPNSFGSTKQLSCNVQLSSIETLQVILIFNLVSSSDVRFIPSNSQSVNVKQCNFWRAVACYQHPVHAQHCWSLLGLRPDHCHLPMWRRRLLEHLWLHCDLKLLQASLLQLIVCGGEAAVLKDLFAYLLSVSLLMEFELLDYVWWRCLDVHQQHC